MSIRSKAALIVLSIVLGINGVSFFSNLFFTNKNINETVSRDLSHTVDIVDDLVATKILLIKAYGARIAERLLMAGSVREMTDILASEVKSPNDFTAFSVYERERGVIANYGVPVTTSEMLSENKYLQMAYNGQGVISTTTYDEVTNDFIMHVFIPMNSRQVLVATIDGLTFSNIISNYRFWKTGTVRLFDSEGTTVASSSNDPVLKRENLLVKPDLAIPDRELKSRSDLIKKIITTNSGMTTFIYEGSEHIGAYKLITGSVAGWYLLVMAPLDESPGYSLKINLLFSSLVFLFIGLFASLIAFPFIIGPFKKIEDQSAQIREANKRTNMMLNAMPLACHLWNRDLKIFDCNDEALRVFGITDKKDLFDNFYDFSPKYQDGGLLSSEKAVVLLKKVFDEGKCVFEWAHQLRDGTPLPVEMTLVRLADENDHIIAAYVRDLREQKKMIAGIEQRDKLLDTINQAAAILLKSETDAFDRELQFCMGMIGKAMDIDRVYIWKNHKMKDQLYCSQIYEWAGGVEPQQGEEITINVSYNEVVPGWEETLSSGACIHNLVRNMSASEQAQLTPQGILSIFVVPIFLHDEFWGFIGYDNCHEEKLLTESEQSILHSGGLVVVNALLRNEMMKDMKEAAVKLETVVSNFPGMIWSTDLSYRFSLFDGQLAGKFTDDPSYAIGKPIGEVITGEKFAGSHEIIIQKIKETYRTGPQDWVVAINGSVYRYHTLPFYDDAGRMIGVTGIALDTTEVSRLQGDLELALKEARDANRAKSDFLANMSHEMRTPLNAIIGLAELSLDADNTVFEENSVLEKIYNAGKTLLSMVNDILDISKIEAGKLDLIPNEYALPSLINDTISLNILRIGEKPIRFILDITDDLPSSLYGDELRVRQILNNLLSNAFKYTIKGKVELSIRCEYDGGSVWLIIRVKDSGIGIKPEDLGKLFNNYSQVNVFSNHKIEGTGLGLSITKKLAEMMDGTIDLESEYGKGSIFTAKIRQKPVNDSKIGADVVKNLKSFNFSDAKRKKNARLLRTKMPYARVLVVDDVETNLDVAKGMMGLYGMAVDCVTNGRDAIDIVRKETVRYDAIFMDHMMPEMDGIEATRIIREEIGSEYAKTVPIIALTANAIVGNEKLFLEKGFQAFLSKPIDVKKLDEILDKWIRSRQSEETLMKAEQESLQQNRGPDEQDSISILNGLSVEGIDFAQAMERYNDEPAYLNMLRSYYMHTPALLEKMKTFSGGGDAAGEPAGGISLNEYRVTVHGLKGSSYGISANAAGDEAKKLEMSASAGDISAILANNGHLIHTIESLLGNLGEILKKITGTETKQRSAVPDPRLLSQLFDAARDYKATVMWEIIQELESCTYEYGGELVSWLRNKIDILDYDAIQNRLEKETASVSK